jgi:hypothetical protein
MKDLTVSRTSPKGSKRGCLCALINQGIGKI